MSRQLVIVRRGRSSKAVRGGAVVVLLALVVAAVVLADPWSSTSYRMPESSVWLAKDGRVGRLNTQIAQIDLATSEGGDDVVLQNGRASFLVKGATTDRPVVQSLPADDPLDNPKPVGLSASAELQAGGQRLLGLTGGQLVIVGDEGRVLPVPRPLAKVGDDAVLAAGPGGGTALSPKTGELLTVGSTGGEVSQRSVDVNRGFTPTAVSLVGDRVVVLDDVHGVLDVAGRRVRLDDHGSSPVLQEPGPTDDRVLVATEAELIAVDLQSGAIDVLVSDLDATPVAPASDGRCAYGAWAGGAAGGTVRVRCPGSSDRAAIGPGTWSFRTGGGAPVLNDATSGAAYQVLDDALVEVSAWPEDDKVDRTTGDQEPQPPNPEGTNPPVAVPDVATEGMGARPGRTTYLQVMRNDFDIDGDVVYITGDLADTQVAGVPGASLAIAQGGRSVAVSLPATAPVGAKVSFTYRISDGERTSAPAPVEVIVRGDNENKAPQIVDRYMKVSVDVGRQARFEALSGFWDFDGDPMYISDLTVPAGGVASSTPDGWLNITAPPSPGGYGLTVHVRDVRASDETPGTVAVSVVEAGTPPTLRNDFQVLAVGVPAVIRPLANDTMVEGYTVGAPKVLRGVTAGLGDPTVGSDTLTYTPKTPGDYVVLYQADDPTGAASKTRATILLHVLPEPDRSVPVALPDVVLVEPGEQADVDVLANDTDPAAGGLSVVDLRPDAVSTTVTGAMWSDYRTFVADASTASVPGLVPTTFTYDIVNDAGRSASGTVSVIVIASRPNQGPVPAPPPTITVRAGDVATIPLAALAKDPDGDPLGLRLTAKPSAGEAAESGEGIRYFAPDSEATVQIQAEVTELDQPTQPALPVTATVVVTAGPGNAAPTARDLLVRVRAGGTVVVPVAGLDPDGDTVSLVGRTDSDPIQGSVTEDLADQVFRYQAPAEAPTLPVRFRYKVKDRLALESAEATVTALVSATKVNHPPSPLSDELTAKVGAEVWIDPVANDPDLDGDQVVFVPGSSEVGSGACTSKEEDGGIRIAVGSAAGECSLRYQAVDTAPGKDATAAKSAPVFGQIQVHVLDTFGGYRPIAHDDRAIAEGRKNEISLEVLRNDGDPDGPRSSLTARLVGRTPGARLARNGRLSATLADRPTRLRYRITDADGLSAEAVVWLPGKTENRPPVLRSDQEIKVKVDDQAKTVGLAGLFDDPDGDQLTFTDPVGNYFDGAGLADGLAKGKLVLRPTSAYVGPADVQVTVDDGQGGRRVVAIPVRILPRDNQPPTWIGQVAPSIERAGEPALIDLSPYASDPDDGDTLTFKVDGVRGPIKATIEKGRLLKMETAKGAEAGDAASIRLLASDKAGKASPLLPVTVEITRNTSQALAAGEVRADARQGETVTLNVAASVQNARAGLKLTELSIESGDKNGRTEKRGTSFTFTSSADYSGDVTIRYTVDDDLSSSKEPRKTSALAIVRVAGKPGAPSLVNATAKGSKAVEVRWQDGASNNAAITGYLVSDGGRVNRKCEKNPCQLSGGDGLENGKTYRFTVVATNKVGPSPASPPSNDVTPDTPPKPPTGLTAKVNPAGAVPTGSVTYGWEVATSEGTDVTGYVVTPKGGRSIPAGDRTVTIDGPNGTEQCITVQARNAATDNGGLSAASGQVCAIPYGAPILGKPDVAPGTKVNTATLTWPATANAKGGIAWTMTGCATGGGNGTPQAVTITTCTSRNKALTVSFRNEAGLTSSQSVDVPTFEKPTLKFQATPDVSSGEGTVVVGALSGLVESYGGRSGSDATWEYAIDDVPGGTIASGGGRIAAAAWKSTEIKVRVCTAGNDADFCSSWSNARSAEAYVKPQGPTNAVATRSEGDILLSFQWSPPTASDHSYAYFVDGSFIGSVDGDVDQEAVRFDLNAGSFTVTVCDTDVGDGSEVCSTPAVEVRYDPYIPPPPQPG